MGRGRHRDDALVLRLQLGRSLRQSPRRGRRAAEEFSLAMPKPIYHNELDSISENREDTRKTNAYRTHESDGAWLADVHALR